MDNDTDIQRAHRPLPIDIIASRLGLVSEELEHYGRYIAKVPTKILERPRQSSEPGRLILVSAITPTAAGEGKTTTSIGLAQGLSRLGKKAALALREPSLGPCLGMKGGATGGGYSQVVPAERINLHFTGDFHAITTAHNLLAALLDNHLYFGNRLRVDPRRVLWRRVLDMNDRALRHVIVGLGGALQGVPRETGFDITAASEVMAMLCLAEGEDDLRRRLGRTLVGFTYDGAPVTASDLRAAGAMLALLRDALSPNLVQTLEGVPAFIHGGPFANIAHGCNSVLATKTALHLADWVVTEAGFGFDLGAEKFFDIKCRSAGLVTSAAVLVATVRALKMHGGQSQQDLAKPSPEHVELGLPNLTKHVENIHTFGRRPVVALNRFASDVDEEVAVVREHCQTLEVPFAVSDHFARGGEGALELAEVVVEQATSAPTPYRPLYPLEDSIPKKIETVARTMYGASQVILTKTALRELDEIERLGLGGLPVCIAKTASSLSDDPKLKGRPRDFEITVSHLHVNAGAGFVVVLTGDILRMPGLPQEPLALRLDLRDGEIVGLE